MPLTDRMSHRLLGHLLGALDDEEEEWVDARLEHDEEWRSEYIQWRRHLAPLEAMRPDYEPPPGLAVRTCRFVEASKPAPAAKPARRRRMSAVFSPPGRIVRLAWTDAAALLLLFLGMAALLLPAIHDSRHVAKLVSCQNGLRQFGAVMTEYARQHGEAFSRPVRNSRLRSAGTFVADLFKDGLSTESRPAACSKAWLDAQEIPKGTLHVGTQIRAVSSPGIVPAADIARLPSRQSLGEPYLAGTENWAGQWGMASINDLPPITTSLDSPLMVGAANPSALDQGLKSSRDPGRNILFNDGHIDYLSDAARTASPAPSQGVFRLTAGASAPIVFTSDR